MNQNQQNQHSNFFQVFVDRPVLATALNLVLLIIGLVTFSRLELRHTPADDINQFQIITPYPGVSSLTVEQKITKPLEDSLSGLDGVKKINSHSKDGESYISIEFNNTVNHKTALGELRDRILSMISTLPEGAGRPTISEGDEFKKAIIHVSFEDNTISHAALCDYVHRMVEDRLRLLEGVAKVEFWGDKLYQVSILLDPALLMEHQVTVSEVVAALKRERSFASGGELEQDSGKKAVVLNASVQSPEEYSLITIKTTNNARVRIRDVAEVSVTEKPSFIKMRVDGQPVLALQITAKPQANPIQVAQHVNTFVNDLKHSLPPTMKVMVTKDATQPFEASMKALQHTLWEAIGLVGIIVALSLTSVRAALLPMVTVPLCLIGSFALMWIFGFSINPITILALVLAVGLVVDDAIVVVENIHHHMENGLPALHAARKSMKEITFAVIVMTITLAAVYIPVAFQADNSAVMFREFAWTLAGSVLISGLVALTLTPAMCGQFLKNTQKISSWNRIIDQYRTTLQWAMQRPKLISGFLLITILFGAWGFLRLPSELTPAEDEDYITGYFDVSNSLPESVRLGWVKQVENILATVPERTLTASWEWQGNWLGWALNLKPRSERNKGVNDIIAELQPKLAAVAGPHVGINAQQSELNSDEELKIILQYSTDYEKINVLAKALLDDINRLPEIERAFSTTQWQTSRIKVNVDKAFAEELGVNSEAIEDTLYTYLSGRKATTFNFKGFDYNVVVQAARAHRSEFDNLNQFFVAGNEGQWIPLGSLVSLKEFLETNELDHYNRIRGASISVITKPSVSLEKALDILEPVIKKHLPKDASFHFGGKAENFREAKNSWWLTYGLALVFIYLVLAALFESFIHPLVVLLTVPLSVTGAVWAVNGFGGTNNIYTAIGLVTLVGLISKHGILIVDFANRLRAAGHNVREAVMLAAERRLRPVLMTTFAMIFGAIPLVFSLGANANAQHHIGWIIIAGMSTGTVFSLYVIPVVYHQLLARTQRHRISIVDGAASLRETNSNKQSFQIQ